MPTRRVSLSMEIVLIDDMVRPSLSGTRCFGMSPRGEIAFPMGGLKSRIAAACQACPPRSGRTYARPAKIQRPGGSARPLRGTDTERVPERGVVRKAARPQLLILAARRRASPNAA